MVYLGVFFGGGLGAVLRFLIGQWARGVWSATPFLGTFIVNVLGSFFIGILAVLLIANRTTPASFAPFLIAGFLGGFTTFSAYSLDAILLFQAGDSARALVYIVGTVVLSIGAAYLGWLLGMRFAT